MTEAEYQAMLADREEGKDCNFEHLARYAAAGCNRERIERIPTLEAEVIRLRKALFNVSAESRNHADAIKIARVARHGDS